MAISGMVPGYTAADAAVRLQRVQATCASLDLDAILFVGGVDGRDNLGSVHALNYLLGGVSGHELLERQQPVGSWAEDAVLVVRPTSCEIHLAPDAYDAVRPRIALWGDVQVHSLSPRRVLAAEAAADAAAAAKTRGRARHPADSDEDGPSDSPDSDSDDPSDSDDEDEDVLEDFKLLALVSMLAGANRVGVACTPGLAHARDPAGAEAERWPLVQAYGLEGVGRPGFFTMTRRIVDCWTPLRDECYLRLDGPALRWELQRVLPPFERHWREVLEAMDKRSATSRAAVSETVAVEPLAEFFDFATLRRPVDVDPFPPSDAPRLRFGARTDPDVDFNEEQGDVDGSREARGAATATHFTLSSAHPKSPGAFAARTYFLANGARDVALANGFSKVSRETEGAETEGADATEGAETEGAEPGADPNAANASLLRALYACVVSAGRAAMRSAAADPSGDFISAARAAFVAAADAFGVPSRAADRLRVDVVAVTPANRLASSPARARWVARRVFARLGGVVGVDGVPLGGVAYGDSFVVDADGEPLVLTSCVPLSAAWPSAGVESDFVDGCADVVAKTARDAAAARFAGTKTRTRRTTKGKPRGDGRENDAVRRGEGETDGRAEGWTNPLAACGDDDDGDDDEEVLIDAELEMSADEDEDDVFADAGVVSDDDDDDDDEPTAPASRRYALDPALALGPRLLAPRLNGVLRFPETPDPTALDDVDAGEGVDAGAWYAFENGVAFVPASAPPLALVVGANVVAVDVHEGIRDPDEEPDARGAAEAADALVVFRLAKNAPGSRGSHPVASTAWCFSLAATPVAARRRFLREIVPRWRAAAARANDDVSDVSDVSSAATVRVTAALPAYARATEAQRWAVGRARALARRAGNIAAAVAGDAPHKTFPTHAADARVVDAADAASGFETTRRQPRDGTPTDDKTNRRREMKAESETTAEETTAGMGFSRRSPSVPVTLLTGPPGGCQASTASALTEGASASATWIVARVESLRAFAAPTASCFASALEDASRRARRALREASESSFAASPPPPRVLVTIATYAPPAITIAALRGAIERVNAEAEANAEASTDANAARDSDADAGSALSFRHAGTTACLTSDAFFAEGERRPSLGSLAHAASNDVDVVVLLQGSDRSRSGAGAGLAARDPFGLDGDDSAAAAADSSSVGDRERFEDASAWVRAAARGDVERIFGAARLGRDPLAAAATRLTPATPATRRFATTWESKLVASHADAPIRARISARRVVAVGRFDVGALVASVRRAFGAGRVAPPLGPDATAVERAELDATRFLERDPNDETRAATLAWARIRAWTNARVGTRAEEETELETELELDTEPDTEPRSTEPRSTEPRSTEPRWRFASASETTTGAATKETDADAGTTPDLIDERARVVFDASFDFASAAPFSLPSTTSSGMDAATAATGSATATRVEVMATGSDVATRLDLGAMCRAAVVAAPVPAPRKTEASMSAKERAAIAETCESAPTPEGWYHDGARYVRYDGVVSAEHPSLREAIEAYLRDANAEAEERDAARMAANARHAATARVALEETSEACE